MNPSHLRRRHNRTRGEALADLLAQLAGLVLAPAVATAKAVSRNYWLESTCSNGDGRH